MIERFGFFLPEDPSGRPSIQGYDERTLRAGERLHLQCLVKNGNPYPEVHWMKNKNIFDRSYTNNQEVHLKVDLQKIY